MFHVKKLFSFCPKAKFPDIRATGWYALVKQRGFNVHLSTIWIFLKTNFVYFAQFCLLVKKLTWR